MNIARLLIAAACAAAAGAASAQATIDHDKALAGNVTPGDAPGYPVTLSVPGHYVLKSNLVVPSSTGGILITAEGVTLDLNGFTVGGPGDCSQSGAALLVTCTQYAATEASARQAMTGIRATASGTTLRNGTVRGFRGHGVSGIAFVMENLIVRENRYAGYWGSSPGFHTRISGSRILLNGEHGIEAHYTIVERSIVTKNGGHGLVTGGTLVVDSVVSGNRQHGISSSSTPHSMLRGTFLRYNGQGAMQGGVLSQGGNYGGDGTLF